VKATGIFIGGRDVMLAADMLDAARKAMVPPFEVSVIADPSGSYTTAAALVACVEQVLRSAYGTDFAGKEVLILGGTGTVGRIAGVLAAGLGARVTLASHRDQANAEKAAAETAARFGCELRGAGTGSAEARRAALSAADVVLATAAAGVQVMSADEVAGAARLLVAADVNAVAARRHRRRGRDGQGQADRRHAGGGHRRAGGGQRQVPGRERPAGGNAPGRQAALPRLSRGLRQGARGWLADKS
jgi:Methylene-tetrahydromethanopterin dehydrogenase, N-terminal.